MISQFGSNALANVGNRTQTEFVYVSTMNTLLRLVQEGVLKKERVTLDSVFAAVERSKIADRHFVTTMIYRDFQELVQ